MHTVLHRTQHRGAARLSALTCHGRQSQVISCDAGLAGWQRAMFSKPAGCAAPRFTTGPQSSNAPTMEPYRYPSSSSPAINDAGSRLTLPLGCKAQVLAKRDRQVTIREQSCLAQRRVPPHPATGLQSSVSCIKGTGRSPPGSSPALQKVGSRLTLPLGCKAQVLAPGSQAGQHLVLGRAALGVQLPGQHLDAQQLAQLGVVPAGAGGARHEIRLDAAELGGFLFQWQDSMC